MTGFLRRFSIRSRLIALAAAPLALLAVVSLVAVAGFSSDTSRTTTAADSADLASDAASLRHQAADLNGAQTAYAFDIARGVKGATADTGVSRAAYLASDKDLEGDLTRLEANTGLAPAEQADITKARQLVTDFRKVDDQIIALYLQGTPEASARATDLVMGAEIETYTKINTTLADLATTTAQGLTDDVQSANDSSTRNKLIVRKSCCSASPSSASSSSR